MLRARAPFRRVSPRLTCATLRVLAFLLAFACVAFAHAGAVDDPMLSGASVTGDWPGYGRLFDQQRFSTLDEINIGSIARLGLVSSLELPEVPAISTAYTTL